MAHRATLCTLSLLLGCTSPVGHCDAAELTSALGTARAGDVVRVGACRVEGRFAVPSGVSLEGTGAGSIIASTGTAIELGGDGARVASLHIEHGGGHGIVAMGNGSATIEHVDVRSTLGRSAIGISGLSHLVVRDVVLEGPVTEANQTMVPPIPDAADTALFGIVLVGVSDALLEDVSVSGFGKAGVVSSETTLLWHRGTVTENLGIGVWIDGGAATLDEVSIANTLRGFRGSPTWGLIGRRGADLETTGVSVRASHDGFGVAQDTGTARHAGLIAEGHEYGAVLAQHTSSFLLTGASEVRGNDFAGVLAVEADGLVLEDSMVEMTTSVEVPLDDWGNVDVGDGVQLVRPMPGTILRTLTIAGNQRAGILLDLGGGDTSALTIEGATTSATGTGLGCVVQNGSALAGWDARVTRMDAAAVNDPAFAGGLDIVGLVGPSDMPAPDELVGLVGPSD